MRNVSIPRLSSNVKNDRAGFKETVLTYAKGSWYVGNGITCDEGALQIQAHLEWSGQVVASFGFFENEVTPVENGRSQVVTRPNTFRSTMAMEYNSSVGKRIILHLGNQPR